MRLWDKRTKKGGKLMKGGRRLLANEITTEEIMRAVKQTKRGKAVGEDGIANEFLKEGGGSCGANRISI